MARVTSGSCEFTGGGILAEKSLCEGDAVSCDRRDACLRKGKTPLSFWCILCLLDISGNLRKNCMIWPFRGAALISAPARPKDQREFNGAITCIYKLKPPWFMLCQTLGQL